METSVELREGVDLSSHLKSLGSEQTKYKYDTPDPTLLETFPCPFSVMERGTRGQGTMAKWAWVRSEILITVPEFTSLCPKTGQPDFATIVIRYTPDKLCVESKSLKLYLGGFRQHGEFHESCVNRIITDLIDLLDPIRIEVEGQFTPRGGIPFWPKLTYSRGSL